MVERPGRDARGLGDVGQRGALVARGGEPGAGGGEHPGAGVLAALAGGPAAPPRSCCALGRHGPQVTHGLPARGCPGPLAAGPRPRGAAGRRRGATPSSAPGSGPLPALVTHLAAERPSGVPNLRGARRPRPPAGGGQGAPGPGPESPATSATRWWRGTASAPASPARARTRSSARAEGVVGADEALPHRPPGPAGRQQGVGEQRVGHRQRPPRPHQPGPGHERLGGRDRPGGEPAGDVVDQGRQLVVAGPDRGEVPGGGRGPRRPAGGSRWPAGRRRRPRPARPGSGRGRRGGRGG